MDLSANHFIGAIPMEIGNLKNIGELGISDNLLSGRIPDSIGSCISLEVLALQGNFLDGQVPSSLSLLKGLQVLDLSRNNLSGDIPEFLQGFHLLESLNLSYNNFEGVVPVQGIFKNASATLLMGNDKLCGGIPEFHLPRCTNHQKGKMSRLLKIAISSICATLGVALVLIVAFFCYSGKKRKETTFPPYQNSLLNLSYQSLVRATNGFSSANLIGMGSFGKVYKGILDEEGMAIAVKVLNLLHCGASSSFIAECEILKNIRHRNLVRLITVCSILDYQGNDFKALVYEYMDNGSLEQWLHPNVPATEEADDQSIRSLNLLQRLNIAIDVASALDYLHLQCTTPIIHCDLKPSNILLDGEMVAHVGDFGLAKILLDNTGNISTSQSSSIGFRGTIGYAPPEYGIGRRLSIYGDVYSFGILLLEMFTGKRPIDDIFKENLNLHKFVASALPDHVAELADPNLVPDIVERGRSLSSGRIKGSLFCIFRIGVACSVEIPQERMKINDVVAQLHSVKDKLVRPNRRWQG